MTKDESLRIPCELCGRRVQHSHHKYEGQTIARYQLFVCRSCYDANADGWGSVHEDRLLDHLLNKRLPIPARNGKGRLPRD